MNLDELVVDMLFPVLNHALVAQVIVVFVAVNCELLRVMLFAKVSLGVYSSLIVLVQVRWIVKECNSSLVLFSQFSEFFIVNY